MQLIDSPALLNTAYLPNIQYISKILLHQNSLIEIHETYQKQSFRNRCSIYGANGLLDLTIPVIKPHGNRTKTKDILIEYDTNWMSVHWKAIFSAYGHSPFFEIFEEELVYLFEKKEKYLIDFNQKILGQLLESIGITATISYSDEFIPYSDNPTDFRLKIHPKPQMQREDPTFLPISYFQVFEEKTGFISNLSFIDLLFNEGPQAADICKKCYVR
jgi:hypothetical protein